MERRDEHELQVFPETNPEILPENRESPDFRADSGPLRNPQPTPLGAPERRESPGNRPAERFRQGPWEAVSAAARDRDALRPVFEDGLWNVVEVGAPAWRVPVAVVDAANDHDPPTRRQAEWTARLIASAPDLLEALRSIENDDGRIPAAIWELRNAAIAKALGIQEGTGNLVSGEVAHG